MLLIRKISIKAFILWCISLLSLEIYAVTPQVSASEMHASQQRVLLTSIYPLYLIAKDVTAGIETPMLLIDAKQDVHHLQLKPSDLQKLGQSDFILWLGDKHEAFLKTPLTANRNAVALLSLPAFKAKFKRNQKAEVIVGLQDTHIWFDPYQAIDIAYIIAAIRGQQYPQDKARYLTNAARFKQSMLNVVTQAQADVTASSNQPMPYWAYHDAYQYLEASLHLQYAGSLTSDMDVPASATQFSWLQQQRKQYQQKLPLCMIVPAGNYSALQTKLAPLNLVVVNENMQGATSFIAGWKNIALAVKQCVYGK